MAFLGPVPSELTTGDTVWRGSLTKTGSHRARRVLIEGDLPIFDAGRRNLAGWLRIGSEHRLEGAGPAVRPLPSVHRE
jgi:transposase